MLCPKCKTEIAVNSLRCGSCGVKIRSKCPSCGILNKINALNCTQCGLELLRKCPACNAYNLPSATDCRKCGASLFAENTPQADIEEVVQISPVNSEPKIQSQPVPEPDTLQKEEFHSEENEKKQFSAQEVPEVLPVDEKEQLEVKNLVVNSLMNSPHVICSLTAPEGCGKSYVLGFVTQDLVNAKITVLPMEATPVTQLSPFGLFQDLLLMSSGLPNYYVEEHKNEAEITKLLEKNFGLTSSDASEVFNFLYPSKSSYYEEILHNKEKIKSIIKKILFSVKSRGECVLTIDDLELIDAASFELLVELYKDGCIDENFKLFVISQTQKNVDAFLQLTQMPAEKCEKFFMGALNKENSAVLIKNILNGFEPMPQGLLDKIIETSQGSPSYIGQILLYMNENGIFNFDGTNLTCLADEKTFTPPSEISAVVSKRLDKIKVEFPQVYRALIYISMLGVKFNIVMLQAVMSLEQPALDELVQYLGGMAFIKPYGNEWYKFQNTAMWKYLFDYVKQDELFAQCAEEFLNVIETLRLTNPAYRPLMAQNAKNSEKAFQHWTFVVSRTAYIGDVGLYVLAQKQCLKLLDEISPENKSLIDTNIKLRLGRLLCTTEPEVALNFLTTILSIDLEKKDDVDFIDISSNAILAANSAGNYNAVIEIVDNVIKLLDPQKYKLEIALITTRKLKTMLYLGSFEHLVNVIENDVNPPIEDALSQNYTVYNLPISKIFETWLETNLILCDALILQGNNKVYDVIATIEDALSTHVEDLGEFKIKLLYAKAFAATMKGEVAASERLIEDIASAAATEPLSNEFICRVNLLQVQNRMFKKDFSNMKNYLFEAVTFANNSGDFMGKNLLKSALGKIFENEGDFSKAFEIYNDQITYFAKERIAVGALLTWFLIADLCLKVSDNDKALEVAMNALDVAKNPRINSYYFQVLYERLIAEIYMLKGDFDAAKMYTEKSLLITKKFNLEYLNIMLYDFYAKYHIEMFKSGNDNGSSPLVSAKKLYEKAITLASRLGLLNIVEEEKKEYQALLTFAQLKKISLV